MNSKQRVMTTLNHQQPDRVPRYWQNFWPGFVENWSQRYGPADLHEHFGDDMYLVAADERTWPSRAGVIKREGDVAWVRSGWGDTKLTRAEFATRTEPMGKLIEPAVAERIDPDTLEFEEPLLDSRFEEAGKRAAELKDEHFVWCKSGGPYLRAAFMRGDENFWVDIVEDPEWAKAFVERVVGHITTVAIEAMRRFGLQDTGVAIYDDIAANWGPFVGPRNYEKVFLPSLRRMVTAYKDAGAARVMHHSDGNVLPVLDMWVDAGVDAINPVEFRTGMDPLKIKQQYGRQLVCVGGLDNSGILVRGEKKEVREHVLHLLEAGRGGGYVIGPHSIGPDISTETMQYVLELLNEFG